jgi:hypothetical protein
MLSSLSPLLSLLSPYSLSTFSLYFPSLYFPSLLSLSTFPLSTFPLSTFYFPSFYFLSLPFLSLLSLSLLHPPLPPPPFQVQDLAMVLQTGTLKSDIYLENKAGGTRLKSKIKLKTEFIPTAPVASIQTMHRHTGKVQLFVQEAKHLKNVAGMLEWGAQDPYCR